MKKNVLIGIMVGKAKPLENYAHVNHLDVDLLVFSSEGVKWSKKKIQGYLYKNGVWKRETCPFPAVVYNRRYLSTRTMVNKLERVIGKGKVFNCITHFDKLDIYNILKDSEIRRYVPETDLYHPGKFISLLSQYKTLILKPSKGQLGRNIYLIEQINGSEYKLYSNLYPKKMRIASQQRFSARGNPLTKNKKALPLMIINYVIKRIKRFFSIIRGGRKSDKHPVSEQEIVKKTLALINDDALQATIYATDKQTFVEKVNALVNKQKFIVQQFISLDRIDQRIYDIRLYVQKDHQGRWTVSGGFSRVGNPDS
jgi:hypothetical protein